MTLFSSVGSHNDHASHIQPPGLEKEKTIQDISGQKCLESFGKFSRASLWAKTFAGLLIGTGDWYSTRCRLIWKMKATKCSRFYFQLVPLTPPTDEIESGLLPTPVVMDSNCGDLEKIDQRRQKALSSGKNGNGFGVTVGELANRGLLPTPKVGGKEGYETRLKRQGHQKAVSYLEAFVEYNMLPTPATSNYKGASSIEALEARGRLKAKADNLADQFAQSGISSQLNPRFVAEMMGFPVNWTELPFLNGETKA